jgi:hypothetical protein
MPVLLTALLANGGADSLTNPAKPQPAARVAACGLLDIRCLNCIRIRVAGTSIANPATASAMPKAGIQTSQTV